MEQAGTQASRTLAARTMLHGVKIRTTQEVERFRMNQDLLVLMGIAFFCAGLLIREQQKIITDQQNILYDVACDNMALRFHIHNKEVDENA